MKIGYKLSLGYLGIALWLALVGYFSIRAGREAIKASLRHLQGDLTCGLADQIGRVLADRVNELERYAHTRHLKDTLRRSNASFEKMADREAAIERTDRQWAATAPGEVPAAARRLIENSLGQEMAQIVALHRAQSGYPVLGEIFVTNRYGVNAAQSSMTTDYRQDDETWWQEARHEGIFVGDVAYDRSAGIYSVEAAVRVEEEGEFLGVLKAVINIQEVIAILEEVFREQRAEVNRPEAYTLVNGEYRAIYSTAGLPTFHDLRALRPPAGDGAPARRGTFRRRDERGEVFYAYARVIGPPGLRLPEWMLLSEYRPDRVIDRVAVFSPRVWAGTLLVGCLAVATAWMMSRSISRRLARLERAAQALGRGEAGVSVADGGRDEIGDLSRALERMVGDLRAVTASRDELDREVAERRSAEEALRRSEQRYRMLVETMNEGVGIVDEQGRVQYWNDRMCAMLGYERAEVVGRPLTDFLDEANRAVFLEQLERRRAGVSDRYELAFIAKDGRTVRTITSPRPLFDERGAYAGSFAVSIDVTDLRRAEAALRESEARFRELYDAAPVGVHEVDTAGRIVRVNRTEQEMLGYTEEEMVGRCVWEFIVEQQISRDAFAAKTADPSTIGGSFERTYRRKDGSVLAVLVQDRPLFDREGRLTGIRSAIEDITPRKKAQQQLRHTLTELARSNEDLEQFAYAASHDLQEPLRKIQAFGERLEKTATALDEQGREYLKRMRDAAARMGRLIEDLLKYSRVGTRAHPFEPVDLGAAVRDVVEDLDFRVQRVQGRVEVGDLPTIEADPTQMRQLFQNLIGNALKFHKRGQPPHVRIGARTFIDDLGREMCEISVQDNGIGFDERFLDRIFVVFQRLHARDEYRGTGIGLAICRKIAQRHGGRITARSRPGEGATFLVYLPCRQAEGGAAP